MFKSAYKIENGAVVFQLANKTKHNNNIDVICETSEEVTAPYIDHDEEKWVVPNDVIGLESKKSKSVKIRFHPSVIDLSAKNSEFHTAACKSSIEYLDCLLEGSEWTRRENNDDILFDSQLDALTSILCEMDRIVEFTKNKFVLSFLKNEQFDELLKLIACKSIKSHFFTTIIDDEEQQIVQLVFKKDDTFERTILKFVVDADYLDSTQTDCPCDIEISKSCISWILTKKEDDIDQSPPKTTQKLDFWMFVDKMEQEMPVYSPCYTIFHLTEQLNITLQGSPNPLGSLTKMPQNLAQDVIVCLDKNNTPQLSKMVFAITSIPLIVNTDFDPEIASQTESELAWSPTESIDSGVSLSPTLSIDETYYSPLSVSYRERSCSESGGVFSGCFNGKPKSILKWPQKYRGINRSYSECHDDFGSLSPLSISPPFFEDEEDIFHEDDENEQPIMGMRIREPRKKSVSFSEKIDKRVFNSNTSIEAQKRKNMKKNEKKKKRGDSMDDISDGGQMAGSIRINNRHLTV